MIHHYFKTKSVFFLFALVLLLIVLPVVGIRAQSRAVDVQIYDVNIEDFPTVKIRTAPKTSDGKLVPDLTADSFRAYEDGKTRPIGSVDTVFVGTQIAIVLDAAGSFKLEGATDPEKRRYDEAIDAIDELILENERQWIRHDVREDDIMLMLPTSTDEFVIAQEWTDAYTAIHNAAYQAQPTDGDTPLLKMLQSAMASMKDIPDYQERSKFVLVFSDGIDRISAQQGTDVISRANSLGATILGVKIGPADRGSARNIQRLAEETGGAFVTYDGVESLAPLYEIIQSQGEQYEVNYASGINTEGEHIGQLGVLTEGREDKSETYSIAVNVKCPDLLILDPSSPDAAAPLDGKKINRVTNDPYADLATLEPRGIPIPVTVQFPDGHPREILDVAYLVNGRVEATLSPQETFLLDFSQLDKGSHKQSLVVRTRDSFGMTCNSESATITVTVDQPPIPTSSVIIGHVPTGGGDLLAQVAYFVSGQAAGGAGDVLWLLNEEGETASTNTVLEDGSYLFDNLPPGNYIVRNMSRDTGRVEVGPFQMDGTNSIEVPPNQDFDVEPPPPLPRWFWFLLVLILIAIGLAVFVLVKRPQAVQRVGASFAEAVRDVTEPFRPKRGQQHHASAYLVPVLDDAGTRGNPIPLSAQSVYVGRDPAQAQITFADRSVSRMHARIVEESDGVFLLFDEGSASGTYLNEVPVGHEPQRLNAGDVIEFGRVRTIFVPESDADVTEPFLGKPA